MQNAYYLKRLTIICSVAYKTSSFILKHISKDWICLWRGELVCVFGRTYDHSHPLNGCLIQLSKQSVCIAASVYVCVWWVVLGHVHSHSDPLRLSATMTVILVCTVGSNKQRSLMYVCFLLLAKAFISWHWLMSSSVPPQMTRLTTVPPLDMTEVFCFPTMNFPVLTVGKTRVS